MEVLISHLRLYDNLDMAGVTNLYGDWNGLSVRLSNAALTEERAFDILDRMTNLVYRNASAAVVGSFSYRYDVLGLVTQKIAYVAATSVTNVYAYDKIGRLTNEITRSGSTTTTRFTYDLAGNRLTAGASTYTYANNRLNGALHDTAGNITNLMRGTTTLRLSWNTLGQLTSVTTNNVIAESYAYDPLGRRVKTTAGGATVYHVYQGDECAVDLDSAGNPLRSYTFGQGIDNLLAMTVYTTGATNTYYAVKDHLGSVQALVNVSGSVVESYTYDAWGVTTIKNAGGTVITSSAYGNRYMFQGREYSTVTGLYNFRARWYAPTIGRWLSKDPIGLEGGLNLYAFCGNNAVNFVDPLGLDAVFLVGRNRMEPSYFTSKAQKLARGYERYNSGEKAYIVQVRNLADVQNALKTYKNIRRLDYLGHGGPGHLYLSDLEMSNDDVKTLDTSNTAGLYSVNIWSCKSGAGGKNSIAQAFADHFGTQAVGATGNLSWGLPLFGGLLTLLEQVPRGTFDTRQPAQTDMGNPISTFPKILRPSD